MLASAACPLAVTCEPASPLAGAKPGTSGLRKKTAVFMADNGAYLRGFTQALFDALPAGSLRGATLVVGGDGRFFTRPAVPVGDSGRLLFPVVLLRVAEYEKVFSSRAYREKPIR